MKRSLSKGRKPSLLRLLLLYNINYSCKNIIIFRPLGNTKQYADLHAILQYIIILREGVSSLKNHIISWKGAYI